MEMDWWMDCDFKHVNYTKFERFTDLQGDIIDRDTCIMMRSQMFAKSDLDDNFVLDQCEIAEGCFMTGMYDTHMECLQMADQMSNFTMVEVMDACNWDYPNGN